jgi:hypothetical protein
MEFQKTGLFTALFQHLGDHHARLNEGDIAVALEGLCILALTEEFETNKVRWGEGEGASLLLHMRNRLFLISLHFIH